MIEDLWFKNAIIYSLDLETFMDGDGDGVGDFPGLIARLDYLEALGVDVIWLAPFQPTPNRDNGYDVSDYYGVDPRHGSGGDFVQFVHLAKKRGFRVLMDIVINHTSDQHRWFQEARSHPESRFRDWYVWSKDKPPKWDEGMVFPGEQEATWTWDEQAQAWYFHRFYEHQPDLNVENPEVREEIRRIMGFWLQLGVDGFRVDAVPFVLERPDRDSGGVHPHMRFDYVEELRSFAQWRVGDAILLGEANVPPDESAAYFREGRGIHMMFNFWVNQHLFYALATGDAGPLVAALEATREIPSSCQWAQFLRNHDELDLGRLDDDQRAAVFAQFGPDPSMQLYERGIRRRLAPMLGDREHLELAYSLLLSLPGAPVLRYGDEIGMGDDLSLDERDAVRTPMQWSADPGGGFSSCPDTVHPVIEQGPYAAEHVNVDAQRRDPGSLLRWTIRMVRVRKECPEIGWGTWQLLPTGAKSVLAMLYTWEDRATLVVHNTADQPQEVEIAIPGRPDTRLVDLLGPGERDPTDGRHPLALEAYGYRWFRLR